MMHVALKTDSDSDSDPDCSNLISKPEKGTKKTTLCDGANKPMDNDKQ